jgi:hypothetical protein
METTWHLVSPVAARLSTKTDERVAAAKHGKVIGFLSNRKPNTSLLQSALAERAASKPFELQPKFYEKANSAVGASPDLLNRISAECSMAITGTGD